MLLLLSIPVHQHKPIKEIIIYYPIEEYNSLILNHIKKYEGLHNSKSYIGWGHKVKHPKELLITNYDSLALEDLKLNTSYFKNYKDSIALGLLSYNVGLGNVLKSNLLKYLHIPVQRDSIWRTFIYINGKKHNKLLERRNFELKLIKTKN